MPYSCFWYHMHFHCTSQHFTDVAGFKTLLDPEALIHKESGTNSSTSLCVWIIVTPWLQFTHFCSNNSR
jgi:hypothetical protein